MKKIKKIFFPIFFHENANATFKLGIDSESTGTKTLYINLLYYYMNLQSGGVLLLDEFDINLHPDILPHLLNLFTNPKSNPKNTQMIFTSLNPDILGKYRAYLFEKEDGESFGYRLDEPDTNILRNDRKVSAPYRRHLLGDIQEFMKHNNSRKDKKLANFPKESVETTYKTIKGLLSFNFKYLDSSQGQKFSNLAKEQFSKLIEKLRWFSSEDRKHWESKRIGNKDGRVLSVYNDFPQKKRLSSPRLCAGRRKMGQIPIRRRHKIGNLCNRQRRC